MKIAITGTSGFVGLNLYDCLKTDYEVIPMSVRYKIGQCFDIQEDIVIHLAGKAHDLKNVSNPKDYYEANFELTKQLFDAFLISKASVFVFMSTVKAVSDKVDGVLTEESITNPKTHYGIAKYQAEQYILNKKIPKDKRVYILRPCMIHGQGNKGNLNLLYKLVDKGFPWPLGAFENKRSFLSIENLCFVIKELIINKSIQSGVYNLADDEPVSTNELIKLLAECLGKKSRIWKINSSLIKFVAKQGDYLFLPLNSERLHKLTENYIVSNDKIVKAMSMALPIQGNEGLIKTFNSFKEKIK
ncbi:NAD-dependent epimerase/dehydratase family protein [Flavobacterium sp. LS1R47]|uniref:NAD-dependent epimerase/dehydratase family protein n=1 Tax=Flavobacterium frigoritolerans TaxID=2987686 RepID=A0A9X3C089_9FLAO|nr:NAD-dependent epimerase/dehydratase family protein [Flavobacterium frigoritolerans]MCV9931270.1 NAD-dependent epimerase/dehydratase family protein [Flavobacterium frigoritolerans]